MRPPPRSTLFPYTTLFRSWTTGAAASTWEVRWVGQTMWHEPPAATRHRQPVLPRLLRCAGQPARPGRHPGQRRARPAGLHRPPGGHLPAHPPGLLLGQLLAAEVAGGTDREL